MRGNSLRCTVRLFDELHHDLESLIPSHWHRIAQDLLFDLVALEFLWLPCRSLFAHVFYLSLLGTA
jgi:hypothetical protein